jgi:response regulator RpfG family c-di-GMP phosphodiesterase
MQGTPLFDNPTEPDSAVETVDDSSCQDLKYWTILVVDDENHVHELTQLLLEDFRFENVPLNIVNAYSGEEAKELLRTRNDIALVLLDVVMETDHAGLDVARYAREVLKNRYTRIVLRTGQPGHAPEAKVIRDYDIDDYKDKTELTDIKLYTLIYSCLRSYRDICTLDQSRRGLERIITSSLEIIQSDSMFQFASAMLSQITNILSLSKSAIYCTSVKDDGGFKVLAATGEMTGLLGADAIAMVPAYVREGFDHALSTKASIHQSGSFIGYYETTHGSEGLLYIEHDKKLSTLDKQLLEIFSANVAIGYENLLMQEEVMDTQKEVVYMLGEAVEQRSKETGAHVKRIAYICQILALKYGLGDKEAELIKLASPLHDVGKVGIPDEILNKVGRHTSEEWEVMKSHAQIGQEMLSKSERRILKLSSIIAGQHHEKWDGSGYPLGLEGEEIHVSARICALADVFDALGSDRCYKDAWETDDIIEYIKSQSGKQFEPKLVDLFIENLDEIKSIRENYPDH